VVSPTEPGVVDRDKIPSNVQTLSALDFDHAKAPDLLDGIFRALPGVSLSDQTGNEFQRDLNYRGFTASPVIGTPQGLAVYQNGVRINEVFGDTVNWDFIPESAINGMTLVPSNPVYGLNAIGGALSFETKNGFTYHGVEGEVSGGAFGRVDTSVQAGGQNGNLSAYITADAIDDVGWRDNSQSRLRRVFADFGARGDRTEFHLTFTGADNLFGAAAATPMQMLSQDWSSVYTIPQTAHNQLAFLTESGSWKPTDTFSIQSNLYYRGFWQSHTDGNGTDAQNSGCPDPTLLCFPDINGNLPPLTTIGGSTVPATGALGSSVLGEIDRTWTSTNSFGGSLQAASSERLLGHDNNFAVGASVDRGLVQFTTTSELGTIDADQFPSVVGTGLFIDRPSGDVAPVRLGATTLYSGIYATDTFDVTSRLSLTAGGRFNIAEIDLQDELGNDPGLKCQSQLQPRQSDRRRHLQAHAEPHGLWRLFGSKPRADSAGARLFRPDPSVLDRQRARRRSRLEAGCLAHVRGRVARALRNRQRTIEMDVGRVPYAELRRHYQRREPDRWARIFSELRRHTAPGDRGRSLV
jgi:iron complex outermembrane receptor protein